MTNKITMEQFFPAYMSWTSRHDHATTFSGIGYVEDHFESMAALSSHRSVLDLETLPVQCVVEKL